MDLVGRQTNMKKLLILLLCLCLTFFVVACKDPVDSDTDTNSNVITDSDSDAGVDSDSDTQIGAMYKVTVVDQDGNKINGAKIVLLDEFGQIGKGKSKQQGGKHNPKPRQRFLYR